MNKFQLGILLLLYPLLYACSSVGEADEPTYMVERGDFRYILRVDGLVEPVKVTNVSCPQRMDGFVTFIIDDGTWVEKGDTLCVIEDAGLESQYDAVLLQLEEVEGNLAKFKVANEMNNALLESEVLTNEAETKIAELDSLQLKYMPASQKRIKELELEIVALRKKKLEEKIKVTPVIQNTELNRYNVELQNINRQLLDIEKRLAGLTILAPKKGLAMRAESMFTMQKLKVGDNVWNGQPVISMPDMEKMKVKIYATESNFNAINERDSVLYTFDAMPGEKAIGKITKKSRAWKPITRGSNVKVYEVEASIDSLGAVPDPGFTVKCDILLRELRDTVFIPQIAVFNEDSIRVVYVKGKKGFEMRQVVTGLSSNKEVVINAGLDGGEEIAFIRPKDSHVRERVLLPDSIVQKYGKEEKDGLAAPSAGSPPKGGKPRPAGNGAVQTTVQTIK